MVKSFRRTRSIDDSDISVLDFPFRTSVRLHNVPVTPKMVKKVIADPDSSKAPGFDCILVLVLKNLT